MPPDGSTAMVGRDCYCIGLEQGASLGEGSIVVRDAVNCWELIGKLSMRFQGKGLMRRT